MGAWMTSQVAAGKTVDEAYRRAVADATAEYGHQEGYSGAINSKAPGYTLVELPARFTYAKLMALISDYEDASSSVEDAKDEIRWSRSDTSRGHKARLAKAQRDLAKAEKAFARVEARIPASLWNFDGIVRTYSDKWDAPLAVEITGAERSRYGYVQRKRGERLFIFFGYAPS